MPGTATEVDCLSLYVSLLFVQCLKVFSHGNQMISDYWEKRPIYNGFQGAKDIAFYFLNVSNSYAAVSVHFLVPHHGLFPLLSQHDDLEISFG